MASESERFWSRVKKTETCWLWTGGLTGKGGYGRFALKGNHVSVVAHRYSWTLANRREIPVGLVILHSCDVPQCVRPEHLSLGTQTENMRDCISKGRFQRTPESIRPRLGSELVESVRARLAAGHAKKTIAKALSISPRSVRRIANNADAYADSAEAA